MRKILVILMFMISTNMNLLADSIRNCHIDSMLIHYVDFDIMTVVDIGCENFESSIGNYESVMLRDSIHIYQFKEMLLTDKKEVSQSIDVRCKVFLPNISVDNIQAEVYYAKIKENGDVDGSKIIPMIYDKVNNIVRYNRKIIPTIISMFGKQIG